MIDCNKCNLPNRDDSLYCEHCGARLDTAACRKCGSYLPPKVKFCPKCGYPAEGNVCSKCGKVNPEESAFCPACGNKLGAVSSAQTVASVEKTAKPLFGKGGFAYRVTRAFVLPALLMIMFIFSFFGTFKLNVALVDMDVPVTGFDAVRGMFLLIDPPTEKEVSADFSEFVANGDYDDTKSDAIAAIRDFGALKMSITEESVTADLVMQVLLWGLHSLSLMALTLVFFILSLLHAIKVVTKKTEKFYKFEVLSLALIVALTFGFVVTGGALAGFAIATVALGCAALGSITAVRYAVEKCTRENPVVYVRRGVCALLAVLMMCFAGSRLLTAGYDKTYTGDDETERLYADYTASVDASDLYVGMGDSKSVILENINELIAQSGLTGNRLTELTAGDLDQFVGVFVYLANNSTSITETMAADVLGIFGNPALMCFTAEAKRSYSAGATALSWLLFAANLLLGAAGVLLLFKLLCEDTDGKKRKTVLWSALIMAGALAVLAIAVIFTIFGNSISSQLHLGFKYAIGALPIVTAVLGIAGLICDAVMRKCDKKEQAKEIVQ